MQSERRLVLVTGASAGLGAAFARAYAKRGYDLALTARRADRLEALAKELADAHGIEAFAVPADLAVYEAHKAILEAVAARGRRVEVLINNAGYGIPQSYLGVPWERQRDFLMTMVVNACGLAYGAAAQMVEQRSGAIINVASLAGFAPGVAGNSMYPAAKSFGVKFSQSLQAELKPKGVKVTALCPGFTRTEFHLAAGIEGAANSAPRFFWQSAEEVVEAGIRANAAGKAVITPGWWNLAAKTLMTRLPSEWVRAIITQGAKKYRPQESW
jgi:short-subunit dehydrogenase